MHIQGEILRLLENLVTGEIKKKIKCPILFKNKIQNDFKAAR